MALAYPEGECFFNRKGLNSSDKSWYQADNPQHFYSHFLLEYIWNKEMDHGSKNCNSVTRFRDNHLFKDKGGHPHVRSAYQCSQAVMWNTHYGNYKFLPISYGPTPQDITRRVQHNLCLNPEKFKSRQRGAAYEAYFMTIPMPTVFEKWIYIDSLAGVRGIYLPIAHEASKQYPEYCTFIQINFTRDAQVKIVDNKGEFSLVSMDKIDGIGPQRDRVLGLNVPGLINLLALPRQLRKHNAYTAQLIKWFPTTELATGELVATFNDSKDFDWTRVMKANVGLDLQWMPMDNSGFWAEFIKNTVAFAAGQIPMIGPVMQVAFTLGWVAMTMPEQFMDELREQIPAVHLTEFIIEQIKSDSEEMLGNTPPGWKQFAQPIQVPIKKIQDEGAAVPEGEVASASELETAPDFKKADHRLQKTAKTEEQAGAVDESDSVGATTVDDADDSDDAYDAYDADDTYDTFDHDDVEPIQTRDLSDYIIGTLRNAADSEEPMYQSKDSYNRALNMTQTAGTKQTPLQEAKPGTIDWPYYYLQKSIEKEGKKENS